MDDIEFRKLIDDVICEYDIAVEKFGAFNTQHEAYAVILEEMDELWDEIKKQSKPRTPQNKLAIMKEAAHVAAMAIRLIVDMGNPFEEK